MSLYYEAATFIADSNAASTSLKSRVYNSKSLKSTPAQVFALVSEASKWSPILKEVVEKSQLLVHERKVLQFYCS
jgi:putative methyltransferase